MTVGTTIHSFLSRFCFRPLFFLFGLSSHIQIQVVLGTATAR